MFEKVFYTSVLVSDQDKALDFYTNVLGLEKRVENPTPDGPRFLTVGVKGDDFQLVLWPGTQGQAEPAMGRPPASITIETDDCRKTVEELQSRGVEFVSDVLEFPWGYVAQFQDPDGNRLQIREGPIPRAAATWRLRASSALSEEPLVNARGRRLIAGGADHRLTLEAEHPAVRLADDVVVDAARAVALGNAAQRRAVPPDYLAVGLGDDVLSDLVIEHGPPPA